MVKKVGMRGESSCKKVGRGRSFELIQTSVRWREEMIREDCPREENGKCKGPVTENASHPPLFPGYLDGMCF